MISQPSNSETHPDITSLIPTPIPKIQNATFADKLKLKTQAPKKDQAIILSPVQGIPLKEYVVALGNVLQPTKILFASRISNNRICIYLDSKKTAEDLTQKYKTIKVNTHDIPIRNYLTPTHRIVIWAFPTLPDNVLIEGLQNIGIKPESGIQHLSAGIHQDNFNHILSFRRQLFVHQQHPAIPDSIEMIYENEKYRVFISLDENRCPICKKFGHDSDSCKTLTNTTAPILTPTINPIINSSKVNESEETITSKHITTNDVSLKSVEMDLTTPSGNSNQKRHLSASSQEADSDPSPVQKKTLQITHDKIIPSQSITLEPAPKPTIKTTSLKTKKSKTGNTKNSLNELIEPLRENIEKDADSYPLSFDQLQNLISDSKGNKNISPILTKFSIQPDHLSEMLKTIHSMSSDRIAKTQLSKFITKLDIKTVSTDSEITSD